MEPTTYTFSESAATVNKFGNLAIQGGYHKIDLSGWIMETSPFGQMFVEKIVLHPIFSELAEGCELTHVQRRIAEIHVHSDWNQTLAIIVFVHREPVDEDIDCWSHWFTGGGFYLPRPGEEWVEF